MKLHPRTIPVGQAEAEIRMALIDAQDYHGLTDVEMLRFHIAEQERISRLLLRAERHPDNPELKGDEACNGLCRHDLPTVRPRTPEHAPCAEETWSWRHFNTEQVDGYWIRCSLSGPHDEHKDAHTGLTWSPS